MDTNLVTVGFEKFLEKKLKILFWDDEHEKQTMLYADIKRGLNKIGWSVYITADKEEAKTYALTQNVDVVVLDLMEDDSPVGLDILKYLRKKRPLLPIIMFSIRPELVHIQNAMRGDVSYYLTKPIAGYQDIIRAVEVAIEREAFKNKFLYDKYYASIGELAAGVAHFIKNSLWNIDGRTDLLLEQTDKNTEAYELLDTIKRRCDDANKVVVALLEFARGKNLKAEKRELNIAGKIQNVLDMLSFELKRENFQLNLDVPKQNVMIKGNGFYLQEAILNIIKNAIEAMPDGGTLTVHIKKEEEDIEIIISDTGAGMNAETLDNLFMPFYTTKANSFGFGLFETQRIIKDHDGTIEVESEADKGSTFIITLPLYNGKEESGAE